MATKKSVATAKKPALKKAAPAAAKTKVTTVKSVSTKSNVKRFSFSRSPLLAASIAEFIGAFALAGIILATQGASIYVLFTVIALTLIVGAVSGAHFNPAITLGALATKRIKATRALAYVVAQVLGALLALVVLNAFISNAGEVSQQQAMYGQSGVSLFKLSELPASKEWFVLGAEVIGALLFGFAFASATKERSRSAAAWIVGGGLFISLTLSSALTAAVTTVANAANGAAPLATVLNPAVAVALQGVSFNLWPILVYIVAPIVGAVLGFGLRDLLKEESEEVVVTTI
jgi:glycerol uptake facilitator-like aquaporin